MKKISALQLVIIFLPSISLIVVIAGVCFVYQVEVVKLTRDPLALFNKNPLYGFLSNLGVLLWCATVSISSFSAFVLYRKNSERIMQFLFFSALLSMYLLLDDLFQIHEFFGKKEDIIYIVLSGAVLFYLFCFRKIIMETNYHLLLGAVGLLGFSVLCDAILSPWFSWLGHWFFIFEDGAKWLGIVSWLSYFVDTSYHALEGSIE